MKKLVIVLLVLMATTVHAGMRIDAGARVLFPSLKGSLDQSSLNGINFKDDLALPENNTAFEVYGNYLARDFSVRAFHCFSSLMTGTGLLYPGQFPLEKDSKGDVRNEPKLVQSSLGFSTGRLEIGVPYRFTEAVIEPQAIMEWTSGSLAITGEDYFKEVSLNSTKIGAGVHFMALLQPGYSVSGRMNITSLGSVAEIGLTRYTIGSFMSVGLRHQTLRLRGVSLLTSGVYAEIGMMF
jgi:hypothetical protein